MSITNIEKKGFRTSQHRNSAESYLQYLEDNTPHNSDDYITGRNLLKSSNYGDLLPLIKKQKKEIEPRQYTKKDKRGKLKEPIQAYSVVQSFDKDEFNYRDPDQVQQAHEAGVKLAEKLNQLNGGGHAWQVFTQADNQHHQLHNHIAILNYDKHHKAMNGIDWGKELYPLSDQIIEEYMTTPKQKKAHQKTMKGAQEAAKRSNKESRALRKERNQQRFRYIQQAVYNAQRKATSPEEFAQMLADQGIEIQARNKKLNTDFNREERLKWYTTKGQIRKTIGFTYQSKTVRTGQLHTSPQQLIDQFIKNKQWQQRRQKQRQMQVEKAAEDKKQATKTPTKAADKKLAKPTATTARRLPPKKSPTNIRQQKSPAKTQQATLSGNDLNSHIFELQQKFTDYARKSMDAKTKKEIKFWQDKAEEVYSALGYETSLRAVNETAKAQQEQKRKEEETVWE